MEIVISSYVTIHDIKDKLSLAPEKRRKTQRFAKDTICHTTPSTKLDKSRPRPIRLSTSLQAPAIGSVAGSPGSRLTPDSLPIYIFVSDAASPLREAIGLSV